MQKENNPVTSSRSVFHFSSSSSVGMRDITKQRKELRPPLYLGCSRPQGWYDEGRSAFTLIELLVVILIIGVLVAIAVPQYQKSIEKTKATTTLALLNSLSKAMDAYYLTHSEYPTKFEQLPYFSLTEAFNQSVRGYDTNGGSGTNVKDTKSNKDWSFQIWAKNPKERILIIATRISGPYTGGGFMYNTQTRQTICIEHHNNNGIKNVTPAGDYCEKLFHATLINPNDGFRDYQLP